MNLRLWAIAPLLGLFVVVTAEEFGPSIYSGMNARFDPAAAARYRQPEAELRLLLAYQQANAATNHFCLLGYHWAEGLEFVSVHWRKGQMILRWHGETDWPMVFSRR
jgi:hypothetical protein